MKPTEVDSMNRLRVQAENKAALYRRALLLACDGDADKVAFYVSEAAADQPDDSGVPVVQPQQEKNVELPDAIRVPLDELEADAAYIIGRVAVDGSCSGIMVEAIRKRTRAIREALLAHGAQGSARDHNEVMALVYLYGSHCAEHPEDAAGQQERLAGVKTALGVGVAPHQTFSHQTPMPSDKDQPA